MRYAVPFVLLLSACSTVPQAPLPTTTSEGRFLPAGAVLEQSGYISIGEVLPAPYPDSPPPEPRGIESFATRLSNATSEEQARLWEEANGSQAFQEEVERLQQILPVREPDNFVSINLLRDEMAMVDPKTLLGAEVWFKRDAVATLAKYTTREDFFPRTGALTQTEIDRFQQVWVERMQDLRWPSAIGGNPARGVLEVSPGVTRERFMAVAAERGWTWGDEVQFTFAPPAPPPFSDNRVVDMVRVFARSQDYPAIQLTALGMGRVVLEDGCFRMAPREGQEHGPLVMFAYEAQLGLDVDGFLIVTSENPWETENYRVGEMGAWGGPNGAQEEWEDVKRLRAQCGNDAIVNVGTPNSLRQFSLPAADWVADYSRAKGLSYEAAWDEIIACYRRQERRGRSGLELRDRCIDQFNDPGRGPDQLPPPPPGN